MTTQLLSSLSAGLGPAVANHLWQSTIFATVIALLVLSLRKNHPQVRYRLWLAASIKFLVPFSLLTTLGRHLPAADGTLAPQVAMYSAFDVVGQPFSEFAKPAAAHSIAQLAINLPVILALTWLSGVVMIALVWYMRWRQVASTRHRACLNMDGREATILLRLEYEAHQPTHLRLFKSPELLEPGIFGIIRPVLLWPERLSDRLDDDHIEAILRHEWMHVRRHDNLTAALHMLVQALFWFHPMVWWIEGRMIEERELACDEAVVQSGGKPDTYAEGLLKACRFCVESPLACVSGISGADLGKRIVRIMAGHGSRRMALVQRMLLILIAVTAIATPIVFGQVNAALRAFMPVAPQAPPPPPPPPPRAIAAIGLRR